MRSVAAIATTPVKGFSLSFPERVSLDVDGVDEDRRFALLDPGGRRLRSSRHAWPCTVGADYDAGADHLTIRLPDGRSVSGTVTAADAVTFDYHGSLVGAHVVDGPWAESLSALAGMPVRLVKLDRPGRVQGEPVTLVSTASLRRLEAEAGREVDARRFRMLFHVDGCAAHEEDQWLGRHVRIGEAVVRVVELVERCVVTTRDPETGRRDQDTLALLQRYRGSLDFGVRAKVVESGVVGIGNVVEPLD